MEELQEKVCKLPLESRHLICSLPFLALKYVCNNLTPSDLAALCAVNRYFRDLFNEDVFWRPHCDQELCEYLSVTPCHVEPKFTSPAVEGSGLSEVCQWRLHYMRQVHFYNNWRQGRYKQDLFEFPGDESKGRSATFYNDDTLIVRGDRGVLLFDVTQSPPKLLPSSFDLENSAFISFVRVCGKNIVMVNDDETVVFAPSGDCSWTRICKFEYQCNRYNYPFLAGKFFFSKFEDNLKIWSIETGVLVKQEVVGVEECYYKAFESLKSILAFTKRFRGEKLFLYDLANLKFLPLITRFDKYIDVKDCKFHNNLLICSTVTRLQGKEQKWIEVYDYLKSTLVTFVSSTEFFPTYDKIELFQNDVILCDNRYIWKFDAAKGILTKLYEEEIETRYGGFRFLGNKHILFSQYEDGERIEICFKGNKYLNFGQAKKHAIHGHILDKSNKYCVKIVTQRVWEPDICCRPQYLLHMW